MKNNLIRGLHVWAWPSLSLSQWEKDCSFLGSVGVVGIVPQQGIETSRHLTEKHLEIARNCNLQVTCGFGMDGNQGHKNELDLLGNRIVEGFQRFDNVMLNWESHWGNEKTDKERANYLVDFILDKVVDASERCYDAPWWAPNFMLKKKVKIITHPYAPCREFGRLCTKQRFVQAYGANLPGSPDGASLKMLDWSRDLTQWPALGTPAEFVLPATQGYQRSVSDIVYTLTKEPFQFIWNTQEMSKEFKVSLIIYNQLKKKGFESIEQVQKMSNLPVTSKINEKTVQAIGLNRSILKNLNLEN
jgi:hypothetical protein